MDFRTMPSTLADRFGARFFAPADADHVIDQLIAERAEKITASRLWPVLRPLLYRFLHYREAVRMADEIAPMPGWEAFEYLSRLLQLDVRVTGIDRVPASGGFILACSHPTGIADGIAVFDMLKRVRRDLSIFANRDALRVSPRFSDVIIPVEWRAGEKSHAKSRDTLTRTARAFQEEQAVVLFPSGRIAFWDGDHLAERPWQNSLVALARRYEVPIVPVNVVSRNSPLFYWVSKQSTELRDMTVFHELLNKKGKVFSLTVGKPIAPDLLEGDVAEVTERLQAYTVDALRADPDAEIALAAPVAAAA